MCGLGTVCLSIRLRFLVSLGDHRSRHLPSRLTLMAWTTSHNDGTCIHLAFLYSALQLLKWVNNGLNSKWQNHRFLVFILDCQDLRYLNLLLLAIKGGCRWSITPFAPIDRGSFQQTYMWFHPSIYVRSVYTPCCPPKIVSPQCCTSPRQTSSSE